MLPRGWRQARFERPHKKYVFHSFNGRYRAHLLEENFLVHYGKIEISASVYRITRREDVLMGVYNDVGRSQVEANVHKNRLFAIISRSYYERI